MFLALLWTLFITAVAAFHSSFDVVYDTPLHKDIVRVLSTVNIKDGNVTGLYFATQTSFENNNVTYMGWQPRKDIELQHLTFSVFGEGTHSASSRCEDGADYGPGTHCWLEYPWKFGQNYTFETIRTATYENGSNTWTGNLYDDVTGEKVYVADFTTPKEFGLLQSYAIVFDEIYYNLDYFPGGCYPKASYTQYAPVFYNEAGDELPSHYWNDWGWDYPDACSGPDRSAVNYTKLNDYAVIMYDGIYNTL